MNVIFFIINNNSIILSPVFSIQLSKNQLSNLPMENKTKQQQNLMPALLMLPKHPMSNLHQKVSTLNDTLIQKAKEILYANQISTIRGSKVDSKAIDYIHDPFSPNYKLKNINS